MALIVNFTCSENSTQFHRKQRLRHSINTAWKYQAANFKKLLNKEKTKRGNCDSNQSISYRSRPVDEENININSK